MKEHSTCKSAIEQCLTTGRFALAHLYGEERTYGMHIHSCLEVYFSICGGKQFFIDNQHYPVQPGDVFCINEYESHCLTQIEDGRHERIVLKIHPSYLGQLCSEQTDLKGIFYSSRGIGSHRHSFTAEQQQKFLYLIHKMVSAEGFGADLVETAALTELLVMLGSPQHGAGAHAAEAAPYNATVMEMVEYINRRIDQPLTIGELAEQFYLSPTHVCRLFKAETGTTIARYLSARRISIAKAALSKGCSVAQACEQSGFNNYNHFIRVFTKTVGISPKQYAKQSGT